MCAQQERVEDITITVEAIQDAYNKAIAISEQSPRATVTGASDNSNTVTISLGNLGLNGRKIGQGASGSVYSLSNGMDGMVAKVVHSRNHTEDVAELFLAILVAITNIGPSMYDKVLGARLDGDKGIVYFMEKFDGDLHDLFATRGSRERLLATHEPGLNALERDVRERIRALMQAGVVCIDVKPGNVLYKVEKGHHRFVLSDFDSFFCCSAGAGRTLDSVEDNVEDHVKGRPRVRDLLNQYTMERKKKQSCVFEWTPDVETALLRLACAQSVVSALTTSVVNKDNKKIKIYVKFGRDNIPFADDIIEVARWTDKLDDAKRLTSSYSSYFRSSPAPASPSDPVITTLIAFLGTADFYNTIRKCAEVSDWLSGAAPPRGGQLVKAGAPEQSAQMLVRRFALLCVR